MRGKDCKSCATACAARFTCAVLAHIGCLSESQRSGTYKSCVEPRADVQVTQTLAETLSMLLYHAQHSAYPAEALGCAAGHAESGNEQGDCTHSCINAT